MLWLILLSEYWRWTGRQRAGARALGPNAHAALDWIDQYGDRDGDGYVEYQTRSPQGLGNQCWRDSGRRPVRRRAAFPTCRSPPANCRATSTTRSCGWPSWPTARWPTRLAERLRSEAEARSRNGSTRTSGSTSAAATTPSALDGDKKPDRLDDVEHGPPAVERDRGRRPGAASVVRQLMSDALFSGWGVRTLSTHDRGYNPIGYHLGTVWPHDNSTHRAGPRPVRLPRRGQPDRHWR